MEENTDPLESRVFKILGVGTGVAITTFITGCYLAAQLVDPEFAKPVTDNIMYVTKMLGYGVLSGYVGGYLSHKVLERMQNNAMASNTTLSPNSN